MPTFHGGPGRAAASLQVTAGVAQPACPELEFWRELRKQSLPDKSEADNYEVSDKEDSDVEEPDRSYKHIPAWSSDLAKVAEMVLGQAEVDPDSIFGPVPHCDLEAIFPDRLYVNMKAINPRRRRGSSCQWLHDRLSSEEIIKYRAKMGQKRRWSVLCKQISQNTRAARAAAPAAGSGTARPASRRS